MNEATYSGPGSLRRTFLVHHYSLISTTTTLTILHLKVKAIPICLRFLVPPVEWVTFSVSTRSDQSNHPISVTRNLIWNTCCTSSRLLIYTCTSQVLTAWSPRRLMRLIAYSNTHVDLFPSSDCIHLLSSSQWTILLQHLPRKSRKMLHKLSDSYLLEFWVSVNKLH